MINEITCYTISNRVTSRFFNAINLNAKPDVMQIYDWDRHSINKKKGVHKKETFLVFRHRQNKCWSATRKYCKPERYMMLLHVSYSRFFGICSSLFFSLANYNVMNIEKQKAVLLLSVIDFA